MEKSEWQDLGPAEDFTKQEVTRVVVGRTRIAISCRDGVFGAISAVCNHVGGPLDRGRLTQDYIACPWHSWKYHRLTGKGEPGFEEESVPSYEMRVENGRLLLRLAPLTSRHKKEHAPHPLERPLGRAAGKVRVAGISATAMDRENPRYSTSEALLQVALEHAAAELDCETRLIQLDRLRFRTCEGYYSKSAHACTWPCSITQMDPGDEMTEVYEALVHWCDIVLLATPIRWGAAGSPYYRMAERLNCIQNQITIRDRVLIRNKVAAFIITGGQDNIQAVAGQMLGFFAELGFCFPQFPFIAHSRGWSSEDMERNVEHVMGSRELKDGAKELAKRSVALAEILLKHEEAAGRTPRGGRKAHRLDIASE